MTDFGRKVDIFVVSLYYTRVGMRVRKEYL